MLKSANFLHKCGLGGSDMNSTVALLTLKMPTFPKDYIEQKGQKKTAMRSSPLKNKPPNSSKEEEIHIWKKQKNF